MLWRTLQLETDVNKLPLQMKEIKKIGSLDHLVSRIIFQNCKILDSTTLTSEEREKVQREIWACSDNLQAMRLYHDKYIASEKEYDWKEKAKWTGKNFQIEELADFDLYLKEFLVWGVIAVRNLFLLLEYASGRNINNINEMDVALNSFPNTARPYQVWQGFNELIKKLFLLRNRVEHKRLEIRGVEIHKISPQEVTCVMPRIIISNEEQVLIGEFMDYVFPNEQDFCELMFAALLGMKLPPYLTVAYIPEKQQNPDMPMRFHVVPTFPTPEG